VRFAETPAAVAATAPGEIAEASRPIAPPRIETVPLATERGDDGQALGPLLAALHKVVTETPDPPLARDTVTGDPDRGDITGTIEPAPDRARHDAKFFFTRGMVAYRFGDFTRALANFDAAIRLDSAFERALRQRAAVFTVTGRFDRAAIDLARADRIGTAHRIGKHRVTRTAATVQDTLWRQAQRDRAAVRFNVARQTPMVTPPAGG